MSKRYVARDKSPKTPSASRTGPLTALQGSRAPGVGSGPAGPSVASEALPDADAACPGQCNAVWRRAEEHWAATGEDHDAPFHPGRPVWCESTWASHVDRTTVTTTQTHEGCADLIAEALVDIERWIDEVPDSGALSVAAPSERHGTGSPPSPSPAFDEQDAFERWLTDLVGRLAERLGHSRPTGGKQLAYAREWLTPLLSGPDAETDGQAILSWQRRLRSIVGAHLWTRLPGVCPACDARGSMRHSNASDFVKCAACRAVYDWDAYHRTIDDSIDQSTTVAPTTIATRRTA